MSINSICGFDKIGSALAILILTKYNNYYKMVLALKMANVKETRYVSLYNKKNTGGYRVVCA